MSNLLLLVFSICLAFFIYVNVESSEAREIAPFLFHLDEQLMLDTGWSYMEAGGKPASVVMKGEEAELPLKILSGTTKPVNLEFHATYGTEQLGPIKMPRGVAIEVEPKNMLLKPNQDQTLKIHVKVDKNAPSNKYDIQIVAQWPEQNGFVGTSFSLHAGRDFGPDSIAVNFFPPPLKQIKEGILPAEVVCTNDYVLVLKTSSNTPACISPQNVSKLIERGWGAYRSQYQKSVEVLLQDGTKTSVTYDINNGVVKDIHPSIPDKSLIVEIESYGDGVLDITIPRDLIDARLGPDGRSGEDDNFFVLVNGAEVDFEEKPANEVFRNLSIPFSKGATEIEIIGCCWFP